MVPAGHTMRITLTVYLWAAAGFSTPLWGAAGPVEALGPPPAVERTPQAFVQHAGELIEAGQHELARTYLEPALIDYRLNPGERSRAYYLRGFSFYDQGMYVSAAKDYNRALEFYPGNPVVLTAMAHLHARGLGVDPDPTLAAAFFEQAARTEHPPAYLNLGIAYLHGRGVPKDLQAAREWLGKAADAGLGIAMLNLGQSYRAPFAEPPQPDLARSWYEQAADAGESDALAYLGFMAENGELEGADDTRSAGAYFSDAAAAGSAVAQAKLAHMYLTGTGVEADPQRAHDLFQQAADKGHPTGFLGLAYLYESGTVVEADPDQAMHWYQRAAEAGMVDAQLRLAYEALREGGEAGQTRAGSWLARAAALDHPKALNDYAWLLATSPFDTVRNGPQAVTLALQAVDRNRSPSYLDTLAAAYAEAGRFDKAISIQREALSLVAEDDPALAAELRSHLTAFEAGEPWRE